jgi:hypothetical protein
VTTEDENIRCVPLDSRKDLGRRLAAAHLELMSERRARVRPDARAACDGGGRGQVGRLADVDRLDGEQPELGADLSSERVGHPEDHRAPLGALQRHQQPPGRRAARRHEQAGEVTAPGYRIGGVAHQQSRHAGPRGATEHQEIRVRLLGEPADLYPRKAVRERVRHGRRRVERR